MASPTTPAVTYRTIIARLSAEDLNQFLSRFFNGGESVPWSSTATAIACELSTANADPDSASHRPTNGSPDAANMAAPSLLPISRDCTIYTDPRTVYLPDLQQAIFETKFTQDTHLFAHRRETVQVQT